VLQAQACQQPFLETFSMILQDELDRRRSWLLERRYQQSGPDERKTLTDFDWSFNPKVPRGACFELHTLKFITDRQNRHRQKPHRQGCRLQRHPAGNKGPTESSRTGGVTLETALWHRRFLTGYCTVPDSSSLKARVIGSGKPPPDLPSLRNPTHNPLVLHRGI
jgi:hypothetical protein